MIHLYSILVLFTFSWTPGICPFRFAEGFTITPTTTISYFPSHRCRGTKTNVRQSLLHLDSTYFGSIPFKEGIVPVTRGGQKNQEEFNISYTLVRPMSLSSQQAAPIVVLHGGPSLPSDYCFPLAKHVPYRSILFYDQLGCGKSDEPRNLEHYSIDQAVDDLETVLDRLSIRRFHLYGHSYGGILAYEYLKRRSERIGSDSDGNCECLSVILSSAPTDVQQMEDDWDSMTESLSSPDLFLSSHLCRTPELPKELNDAYANAGTVWSGTAAISDYKAQPPKPKNGDGTDKGIKYSMPSALILRGEHDVVTELCSKGWKEELLRCRSVRERTLVDCSHHGLLENGGIYGDIVDSYFGEYD